MPLLTRAEIAHARVQNATRHALPWCLACERELALPPGYTNYCPECGAPIAPGPPVVDPRLLDACELAHDLGEALGGKHVDDCPFRDDLFGYCRCRRQFKAKAYDRYLEALLPAEGQAHAIR